MRRKYSEYDSAMHVKHSYSFIFQGPRRPMQNSLGSLNIGLSQDGQLKFISAWYEIVSLPTKLGIKNLKMCIQNTGFSIFWKYKVITT